MEDFTPYEVSIGTVTAHAAGHYIVQCNDGTVRGIPSNGEPSAEAFAHDLAHPPTIPPPVPQSITPRQLQQWLLLAEIPLESIESFLSTPEDLVDWHKALEIRRDYPLVEQLRIALRMTSEQVDDAFRAAALL